MSMVTIPEIVYPDMVFSPTGDATKAHPLDPCPGCGSFRADAPEGVHSVHSAKKNHAEVGDPVWNHPHCWKCGYRPGTNVAVSEGVMANMFSQFKAQYESHVQKLIADQMKNQQPSGLAPPNNDAEIEELKAKLKAAQESEAAVRAQLEANPTNDAE